MKESHVSGESDSSIAPQKQANKDCVPLSAESVEGRRLSPSFGHTQRGPPAAESELDFGCGYSRLL